MTHSDRDPYDLAEEMPEDPEVDWATPRMLRRLAAQRPTIERISAAHATVIDLAIHLYAELRIVNTALANDARGDAESEAAEHARHCADDIAAPQTAQAVLAACLIADHEMNG